MFSYPEVVNEHATIDLINQGYGIARFGDGEFNLVNYGNCVSQVKDRRIQKELKEILEAGSDDKCLVGIPPMKDERIAKKDFWNSVRAGNMAAHLNKKAVYCSSFITRPDNSPIIDNKDYWGKVVDIWRDKDVTLVAGSNRSLNQEKMKEANSLTTIECPYKDAYDSIDQITLEITNAKNKTVILCCGATATVLAWRLRGWFHAIDLGHVGMKSFFKEYKNV